MTRVIATDAHERAMLAVIRCLRAGGAHVTAAASSCLAPGMWSAATAERRLLRAPTVSVHAFIGDLERIVREQPHDLVLPGTDASLLALSRHRERLEPYVRLGLPSREVVERALNRDQVSRAARAVGLDPPEERLCESPAEALAAAETFGYPALVKPVEVVVEREGVMKRGAAALAGDPGKVARESERLRRCIVQRVTRGEIVSFSGVASDGSLLGAAMSRYERTWPAVAGSACFAETIQVPAGVQARVQAFVAEIGWEGIFELELISGAGGELRAIDFNPRPYGSLQLAIDAGAPLPQIWSQAQLGPRSNPTVARPGVRYRWEDGDLRNLLWHARNGDRAGALAAARPRRAVAHAYLSVRDPLPALARTGELVRRAGEKARNR